MKLSNYFVCHICVISILVVELHGYQSTAKNFVPYSRTRVMQLGQYVSQRQGTCGGDVCSPNEKCCESNGIFGTCCPFSNGICCGAMQCCMNGQRCCAGGCCEYANGICCGSYCCPQGERCSGQGSCVPFGRGATLSGTSYLLLVGLILMSIRAAEI